MPGSRRSLLLAAALTLNGCVVSTTIDRPPQSIVVHAVLDMGSRDQLVLLERSGAGVAIPVGGSNFSDPALPILGASVTITGPDGIAMVAREDRLRDGVRAVKGLYRLSLAEYGATLEQGGQYTLRVHTELGEASGTTTVPRASEASVGATETFNRNSDTLFLSWPRVVGAHIYEVRLQSSLGSEYVIFSDTTVRIPGTARDFDDALLFQPGASTLVVVSAVDANYYEYFRQTSDIFLGGAKSRLTGAVGVFGAMVPLAVRRLTVR